MNILNKIRRFWARTSSERYCNYLRKKGVIIGKGTACRPQKCKIDLTRPSLITIGENVLLNDNFSLMTHDFVSGIFRNLYNDFLPSSGKVTIGNNVRFGINCTVLKGVTIGDNCFIGAGSLVVKDIPENSIAAGVPCRVICSVQDYYEKRKQVGINEAFEYVRSIKSRFHRDPKPEDFWEEFVYFVDKSNVVDYPMIPIKEQLGKAYSSWIQIHKAPFCSFEDFVNAALKNKKY